MNKKFLPLLKALPIAVGASLMSFQGSIAAPQDAVNSQVLPTANQTDALEMMRRRQDMKRFDANMGADQGMSQVTSVSELRDVQPTEWAYEALKSLVERYGCIVGYPDRTFRGNRALSRWEFAAGLNACMNVMERLIQENVAVLREDIDKLKALAQQFEQELAALGARVDNLESRVSFLEDHQFSTTTKLNGIAIFSLENQWGGEKAIDWRQQDLLNQGRRSAPADVDEIATFSDRVRLNFDTSFTGKDLLKTRLQAGNVPNLSGPTGTNMARLSFDGSSPNNNVDLNKLWYRFPMGNLKAWVGPRGLALDDVFNTYNPYLQSSDTGALSRFSRYSPFVNRGPEGAGLALQYDFSKQFNIVATYLADDGQASTPTANNGFFNGSFSTGAQLNYKATDNLGIGLSYLHKYYSAAARPNLTAGTGSVIASDPFYGTPTTVDTYNLQGNWKITNNLNLSAWGGYANANAQGGRRNGLSADLWTWNAALSILDLGKEGAVLSFSGGLMPYAPYVGSLTGDLISNDRSAPYIIETQYAYPINKNIQITPGFYVILNPEANSNNSSIWVGVLRTTFKF
ncbi:iron uptake porin [Synechocystis sp. LKSZ1]|uniref:iron uptake porin n=1 Tax=Synechocystis sp. LKSZ1 TaxID=3144951 RepID=UPI00336C1C27